MSDDAGEGGARSEAIDVRLVRRLAAVLSDAGLTSIEVERRGLRIRVAREGGAPQTVAYAPPPPTQPAAPAPAASQAAEAAAPAIPARRDSDLVKSPMVGTVYLQPQPGAAAFVKLGDTVAAGQTLFIIEAMKTMNPVTAAKAGRLVEILVADAAPVEFGQPLAVVA